MELLLFKNMVLGARTKLFKALNGDGPLRMIENVLKFKNLFYRWMKNYSDLLNLNNRFCGCSLKACHVELLGSIVTGMGKQNCHFFLIFIFFGCATQLAGS